MKELSMSTWENELKKIEKESQKCDRARLKGVFTARDMKKALGKSATVISRKLRQLVDDGFVTYWGRVPVQDITGNIAPVPGYVMVKK